jgi:8-oxo-dGTP diphosphatase
MRNVVNGLLVREGSVLLAKRAPQRANYPRLWSFPGGHIEENETLADALVRELREEIGITPTTYTCIDVITDPNSPPSNPTAYHMYCIAAWEGGEPAILGDEHSELAWMPFESVCKPDHGENLTHSIRNLRTFMALHPEAIGHIFENGQMLGTGHSSGKRSRSRGHMLRCP